MKHMLIGLLFNTYLVFSGLIKSGT